MGCYQSAGNAQMPVQSGWQPASPTHTSPHRVCARARTGLKCPRGGVGGNWQMVRWEDLVGVGERLLHYFY